MAVLAPTLYEQTYNTLAAQGPEWLQERRKEAYDYFAVLGFPTTRDEEYKFTSLKKLAATDFVAPAAAAVSADAIDGLGLGADSYRVVFVNGSFSAELSNIDGLEAGLSISRLSEALAAGDATAEALFAQIAPEDEALTALNTALADDGLVIHVAKGAVISKPVEVLYIADEQGAASSYQRRVLIDVEATADVSVVETHHHLSDGAGFAGTVTEMRLGDGARLRHYLKDNSHEDANHIHTSAAHLGRDARLECHSLLIGGKIVRNNLRATFAGPGSDVIANGLFVGHGAQTHDNNVVMDHAEPHNTSSQFFRGILDGTSHGVFTGRVIVREDAQKTDSQQSNKNLLLSEKARVDTQPQLEIYADDVKCAHGATTGQIDEDALFYMMARGIAPERAHDLLVYAFAHEIIDRMPMEAFRQRAEEFLFQRFEAVRDLGV